MVDTNESLIKDGQQQVVDQLDALRLELDDRVAALQLIADQALTLDEPTIGFAQNNIDLSAFTTTITADFESGLIYPDSTAMLEDSKIDGYDSEFLQYLEDNLTSGHETTWASTLRAIQQTYTDATTTSAQNIVSSLFPAIMNNGVDHSSSMLEQVNDAANIELIESTKLWDTIANELLISYQQQAHGSGLKIEAIRAKIVQDMIGIHSDYNRANLTIANKDLSALRTTVDTMRQQIYSQIKKSEVSSNQDYAFAKEWNRNQVFNTNVDLSRIGDEIRQSHSSFRLELAREASLINTIGSALDQSILSGTVHGNYTSKTEV